MKLVRAEEFEVNLQGGLGTEFLSGPQVPPYPRSIRAYIVLGIILAWVTTCNTGKGTRQRCCRFVFSSALFSDSFFLTLFLYLLYLRVGCTYSLITAL